MQADQKLAQSRAYPCFQLKGSRTAANLRAINARNARMSKGFVLVVEPLVDPREAVGPEQLDLYSGQGRLDVLTRDRRNVWVGISLKRAAGGSGLLWLASPEYLTLALALDTRIECFVEQELNMMTRFSVALWSGFL